MSGAGPGSGRRSGGRRPGRRSRSAVGAMAQTICVTAKGRPGAVRGRGRPPHGLRQCPRHSQYGRSRLPTGPFPVTTVAALRALFAYVQISLRIERGRRRRGVTNSSVTNHNRFRNAVMNGAAIGVNEELKESESQLQGGSAIADRPFDGVPKRHPVMDERDNPDMEKPLARGLSIAKVHEEAKVQD